MDDETDIGLVDSHAEGNRRHDDLDVILDKKVLIFRAHLVGQAGMVGPYGIALFMEKFMETVRLLARKAIDDPRFVPVRFQKFRDLLERCDLGFNFQEEIRTIETADEFIALIDLQRLFDVVANPPCCGGGQGDTSRFFEHRPQPAQLTVFRPEIMAPL